MPLTPEEQRELDELEYQELVAKQSQADKGEHAGPLSRTGSTRTEGNGKRMSGGMLTDLTLEAGIPMAGQALTTELSPVTQAVVGGGLSALGNILAQIRRMAAGEQDGFKGGQLTQATLTGAIPFGGPAANAERVANPIVRGAIDAGKTGAKMAGISLTGEVIKSEIDDGKLPTANDAVIAAVVPAVLGSGTSAGSSAARALGSSGRRVAENAASYSDIKATPTAGMLLPEEFAATETKMASRKPGEEVAKRRDAVYNGLNEGIQGVAPNPQEGAAIFDQVHPLIRQVSTTEKELSKLNEQAKAATEEAQAAYSKLAQTVNESKQAGKDAVRAEATKLSNQAFNANLDSALDNARELATIKATGGAEGVDPATARDLFVQHVAKPVEAAFEEHSAQLYSGVDNKLKNFDSGPIMATAEAAEEELTSGFSKKVDSAVSIIRSIMGDESKVSLQQLRNARAELLRKVRLGEFGSDADERIVKGVAAEITQQIDAQAISALGEEGGNALKVANKFYRETRPLFDQKGAEVLFSAKPGDEYVKQVIDGMKKSGVNSDEYRNLTALVSKIAEFNPELGDAAKGHVTDILKRSVIFDASRINPLSPAGTLMVEPDALLKSLRELGKVPGTLEQLGLGSPGRVAELETLMKKYPEAIDMSSKDWDQIFSSPTFRDTSAGSLASKLEPIMAASQADSLVLRAANLKAAGRIAEADRAYHAARETVQQVHGDQRALQAKYEQLLRDPVAIAFNNPGISDTDFNSFARSLFDSKANKITNSDVSAIATALRTSKSPENQAILQRLQERYIADRVAAYHSTPISSEMLEHPDAKAVDLFFNPTNPGDASNEIERAKALLSPEQMNQLSAFAKTAKAIGRYEKLGAVGLKPGSYDIPVVGMIRRGLDAVADLYRQGKYTAASKMLADPAKFSRIAIRVGDEALSAEAPVKAGIMGAERTLTNETSR